MSGNSKLGLWFENDVAVVVVVVVVVVVDVGSARVVAGTR